MRPFSQFNATLPSDAVRAAEVARMRSLATWGYLLLRPGMEFVRQRSNFILGWQAAAQAGASVASGAAAGAVGSAGVPPLGSWMILPELTSPATQTVLPSNDALYGASHVELDLLGPVVISVPAAPDDRYFSVAVMDAHLNNVAHLGPRWTGVDARHHLLVPPGWTGTAPDGIGVIEAPTPSVCLYNRMLVRYADDGLDTVHAWQAGLRLTQLTHWGSDRTAPDDVPVEVFLHPQINTMTDAAEYFRVGLDHLAKNPMVEAAGWLSSLVSTAGLDVVDDSGLRAAVEAGVDDATAMLDAALTDWPRGNGWMLPDPALGRPNPKVLEAAAFQQFQIGSNDITESAYYFCDTDDTGAALDGSAGAVYQLRFTGEQLPVHHPSGYWSLTMYDEGSLLVANPLHRYSTRPERPGFTLQPDGSVVITLSSELPAGIPEATWLPAPAGRFRLGLRVYYPDDAIISGAWVPPAVRRV